MLENQEMEDIDAITDDQNPVLQNIEIHRQRLMSILDRLIDKIEIAYTLDELLEDEGNMIAEFVSSRDLKFLLEAYHTNLEGNLSRTVQVKSKSSEKVKYRKSLSSKSHLVESKQDINNANMITLLHNNKFVRKKVQEILGTKSAKSIEFLMYMKELRETAVKRFYATATEERLYNKKVGHTWKKNEKLKMKNAELTSIRDKKANELKTKLNEKNKIIEEQKNRIAQMQAKCIEDLQNIVNTSERTMANTSQTSTERQEVLSEEAQTVINQYQSLLQNHLTHEKSLRSKRNKVETVLANWVAKYDQDIGELQAQLEEQTDGYDKEREEYEDLQQRFDEQEIQYEELMAEKEEEERKIFEKKLYEFILNRSVRRIQRWWRGILSRYKKRKKGKKGKGKKK